VSGLLGSWASTKHDLSASIKRKTSALVIAVIPPLKASLPAHSFCSYVFAFAPQHPALNSDLTIPTNLSLCYISKRSRLATQFSHSHEYWSETCHNYQRRSSILLRISESRIPADITFSRAKLPLYHRRRCVRFSYACNAHC
jgi:hypothetical protein